jgi:hypothetical protein
MTISECDADDDADDACCPSALSPITLSKPSHTPSHLKGMC